MILRERAYAKLNLALHVRGKLPDGRHEIETIFAFCRDGDDLSATPADEISLTINGPFAAGLPTDGDNLIIRAATALQAAGGVAAGAKVHLHKSLPIASGIGGGSADAAAALRLLTTLWGLAEEHASEVAPKIGSDVPACLDSRTARGDGGGETLSAINEELVLPVLLVNPGRPLATGEVFARWDGHDRGPLSEWRYGRNDLEPAAKSLAPEIGQVLAWLDGQPGARLIRMSGSGATCFALFDDEESRDAAAKQVNPLWWHLATRLR